MSEPTNHPARDTDAADRELARLYHGGPVEEPPPDLDERVLAAAEASRRRRRRWPMTGLATAAVAVLAIAVLLRTAVEDPSIHEPSFRAPEGEAATVADAPAARMPLPARPTPLQRLSQVEEVVVTATRNKAADQAETRYTAPGCREPYPLPQGATIRSLADGIEVTTGDGAFRLRCQAGEWQRQPAP